MENSADEAWLESVIHSRDGGEVEAVERFADRLVRLAKSRLPNRLQQRVDPEDIVQSVFRSFFNRNKSGRFQFQEPDDVWRLLAAITFRKVQRTIRFHQQQQRDVGKETNAADAPLPRDISPTTSSVVVMMELLDGILAQIPERHQQILRLRLEEYSVDEIAEKVGVSSRTVDRALALVRQVATEMIDRE